MAGFCRERELCAPHFYQWKKRLSGSAEQDKAFVEVQVAPATMAASAAIEIRLRGERSLVVEPGFDASHLEVLLALLEKRA